MNHNLDAPVQHHLQQLATYIHSCREELLASWRECINDDPNLGHASQWTRTQFQDHIPYVIDAFVARLHAWPNCETARSQERARMVSDAHAQHRWQQGYDLCSITREWGHLNLCVQELIAQYIDSHPAVLPRALGESRIVWARMYNESLSASVAEFHHLLQAEAATRLRELQSALEELREFERLRGEALRSATHDLRGSLNIVSGSVEILGVENLPDPIRQQGQQMLQRGVSSLGQMLSNLMDMARLEAGEEQRHVAPFDAGHVLTELCQASRSLAETRGLELTYHGPSPLKVEGDAVKVHRIAQNLLLNALKYTDRGSVTVSWNTLSSRRWMLSVQDTGPGIHANAAPLAAELQSATHIANAVEHDSREKNQRQFKAAESTSTPTLSSLPTATAAPGEGIGLSIVKRLCELLDASLELESTPGVGTLFRVTFPLNYSESA